MSTTRNRFLIWLLVLAGFASIGSLQVASDTSNAKLKQSIKKARIMSSEPLIPKVEVLRFLSMGNPSVVADILWLQTIQYFGSGNPYGKYPSLGPMLDTITKLDPHYEYPYEFGLVVLPFMDQTPMAITLGDRAQSTLPNKGLLTYYHATNFHLYLKDYRKAAEYYQKAAKQPGAPGAATTLAGTALSQLSSSSADRLVAREFWKTVYLNAKNEDDKQRAEDWYTHMSMVYTIEVAAEAYKTKTGNFPSSQEELVKASLLSEVLVSPVRRVLELDAVTGKVHFDKLANE